MDSINSNCSNFLQIILLRAPLLRFVLQVLGTQVHLKADTECLIFSRCDVYMYNIATFFALFSGKSETKENEVVGHYTQMVWAESTLIGCAYAVCKGTPVYYCNYGPGWVFGISNLQNFSSIITGI